MRKLRIAQVTNLQESVPPLNKNGLEQVVYYLTEELVKLGHEVTLFATADSNTSAKLIPIWPTAVSRDANSSWGSASFFNKLSISEVLKRSSEFDIIHDHSRFILPHFASLISTPIVSTLHHPINFFYEEGYKETLEKAYLPYMAKSWEKAKQSVHTVAVSNFQKEHYSFICKVVYNGIALNDFKFNDQPQNYFAFLGYITPNKGASQAVQAILKTGQKLKIAGPIREDDPEGKKYFETEIKPFLGPQVQYVGPLKYSEKIDFYKNAKATLMPIQWDEPFGMVAIESMVCGTPVIGWNRAALPEIIEEAVSGYLVNSVEEMAQKISQIDKLDRKNARKRVEEKFTSARMAQDYVNLYNQLLNQ